MCISIYTPTSLHSNTISFSNFDTGIDLLSITIVLVR